MRKGEKDPIREHGTNTRLAPIWDRLAIIYFDMAARAETEELRTERLTTAASYQQKARELRNRNLEIERTR